MAASSGSSDNATNNALKRQGKEGEGRKGEQAGVLFLLRRGGGVRLRCALPTPFSLINLTQQLSRLQTNKKINLVLKNNRMSFYSISISAAQHLAVLFAMSALTAPAETRVMVKEILVGVVG